MRRFVFCKHNCEREYENGDRKPDPSPDILLKGDSHRLTLTTPKTTQCCRMRKRANSSGVVLRILMGADAIATMTFTLWALERDESLFAPSTASTSGSAS
jgi:hypothetical protein